MAVSENLLIRCQMPGKAPGIVKTGMQAPSEMEFSEHQRAPRLRSERSLSDRSSIPGSAYLDIRSERGLLMLDFPGLSRRVMASAMFRTPIAKMWLAMTCSKLRYRESSNRLYAKCRANLLSGIPVGLNASGICFRGAEWVWWRMLSILRKYLFQT